MAFYLDTSALVKLVVAGPESEQLRGWLTDSDRTPVACDLVRTELLRTVRRAAPDRLIQARAVLEAVTLLEVTPQIFETAGRVDPLVLRSLDAIHIAAALDLGDDLEGMVAYDLRLTEAAISNGIPVVAPA